MAIRTLIVDDESPARRKLRRLLSSEKDIEIVGDCSNGTEAVAAINELHPQLILLDMQMPEMNGLDVIHAIGPEHMPLVIFATAYDRYAIQAFEISALDYLLKPFSRERLHMAIARARSQLQRGHSSDLEQRLDTILANMNTGREASQRLMLKSEGRTYFLKTDEIDWIEAAHNYVTLHVGSKTHLMRETMDSLIDRLNPELFIRIHRSSIVNIERVEEIHAWVRGEHIVILQNGTRLTISRSYYERLRQRLGDRT